MSRIGTVFMECYGNYFHGAERGYAVYPGLGYHCIICGDELVGFQVIKGGERK